MQVGRSEQADHPIAQIFLLHEDEDRHDQHDHEGFERRDHRFEIAAHLFQHRNLLVDDPDVQGMGAGAAHDIGVGDHGRGRRVGSDEGELLRDETGRPVDLGLDGRDIARCLVRQGRGLHPDQGADAAQHTQRADHRHEDRQPLRQPQASQEQDDRRQDERQQHRQRDGDQHVLGQEQPGDHDHGYRETQQSVSTRHFCGRHLSGYCPLLNLIVHPLSLRGQQTHTDLLRSVHTPTTGSAVPGWRDMLSKVLR